uniref:Ig-like domain-containing protein n=1 Tax=Glossina pallidipes TaxID=7398 RepID=A0A1B0AAI5_GLOPL
MSEDPPEIIKKPQNQGVRVGGVASFYCAARGDPPPSIVWRKNGKKVSGTQSRYTVLEQTGGVSILRIEPVRAGRDDAPYECVAENGHVKETPDNYAPTQYKGFTRLLQQKTEIYTIFGYTNVTQTLDQFLSPAASLGRNVELNVQLDVNPILCSVLKNDKEERPQPTRLQMNLRLVYSNIILNAKPLLAPTKTSAHLSKCNSLFLERDITAVFSREIKKLLSESQRMKPTDRNILPMFFKSRHKLLIEIHRRICDLWFVLKHEPRRETNYRLLSIFEVKASISSRGKSYKSIEDIEEGLQAM